MKKFNYIVFTFVLFSTLVFTQNGGGISGSADPVATAMGKTYTVTSRGVYALGANPALITWSNPKSFEFSVIGPLNVRAGFDFMTLDDYNYFFGGTKDPVTGKTTGRYLTADDKKRFRELFTDESKFIFSASFNLFSAVYNAGANIGTFGFNITDMAYSKAVIPETFAKLGLEGNLQNELYDFGGTKFGASWTRKYALTYARDFKLFNWKQVSAGISLNIMQGFGYAAIDYIRTSFTFDANSQLHGTGDYRAISSFSPDFGVKYDFDTTDIQKGSAAFPFPTPAGTGFGVDLGFAAQINDKWSIGIALTDLGSMTWTQKAAEFKAEGAIFLDDLLNQEQRDSLVNVLKGKARSISEFSTSLPGALRFGAAFQTSGSSGGWLFATDLNFGFNNEPGNSTGARWSMGMEWNPKASWLPWFRTGFSVGGGAIPSWSFGGGFKIWKIYFDGATYDFQYLFNPSKAKRVSVSLGARWRFD